MSSKNPNFTQPHLTAEEQQFLRIMHILRITPELTDEQIATIEPVQPVAIKRMRRRVEKRRSLIHEID